MIIIMNNNNSNNTNGCNTSRNSNGCQGGALRKGIVTLWMMMIMIMMIIINDNDNSKNNNDDNDIAIVNTNNCNNKTTIIPMVVTLELKVIWHEDVDVQRLQQPDPPLVLHITSNDNDDDGNYYSYW